ncbi:MAG: hypothetical protein HY789_07785 [Deltaproteobacteria bacterium]|nr:hypothetical protein [Deltaproteobacteria bacterium]
MTENQCAVIAAKAGIWKAQWLAGRAALARNDEMIAASFARDSMEFQYSLAAETGVLYQNLRKMMSAKKRRTK